MALTRNFFFLVLIGFSSLHATTASPFNLYVISSTHLHSLRIDPTTSPPSATIVSTSSTVYTNPIGIAVSPDEAHVYVLDNATSPTLYAYQITPSTGAFSSLYTFPAAMTTQSSFNAYLNPLAVHPSDQFVYIADYNQNCINVFATATSSLTTGQFTHFVNTQGALANVTQPVSVAVSSLGTYLGVGSGGFVGGLFQINPTTGLELISGMGLVCSQDSGTDPFVAFSTPGTVLFTAANESGSENLALTPVTNPGGSSTFLGFQSFSSVAFAPNSAVRVYLPVTGDAQIVEMDVTGEDNSTSLDTPATIANLAFSPDGLTLCGISGSNLYIWTTWADQSNLLTPARVKDLSFTAVNLAAVPYSLSTPVAGQNPAATR